MEERRLIAPGRAPARLLAGLVALAACKSDPPAAPPAAKPAEDEAPGRGEAKRGAAGGGEVSACAIPTWAEASPCRTEDVAIAVGDGRTPVIAGEAARGALTKALAGSSAASLPLHPEVPATVVLCGRVYAVARHELPRGADVELEECGAGFPEQPELEDPECPEWTGRVAWIDGEDHHGVGSSELTDEALAEKAARGKAEAEVKRLLAASDGLAKANGDDRKVKVEKLEPETTRCGPTTFVRATSRREIGR